MPTRYARVAVPLPPLVRRVILAARTAPDDPVDRTGHAAALEDLARWAETHVLIHGVLAPSEDEAYKAIEAIARKHLGYAPALHAYRRALSDRNGTEKSDAIERSVSRIRSIDDDAYYYAGLACGLMLAAMSNGE